MLMSYSYSSIVPTAVKCNIIVTIDSQHFTNAHYHRVTMRIEMKNVRLPVNRPGVQCIIYSKVPNCILRVPLI
jgi:hypothetical protein